MRTVFVLFNDDEYEHVVDLLNVNMLFPFWFVILSLSPFRNEEKASEVW